MIRKIKEMISTDYYQKGYDDAVYGFSYIPNFPSDIEKKQWEQGYRDGMQKNKNESRKIRKEGYYRLDDQTIDNEFYILKNQILEMYESLEHGNDFNELLWTNIKILVNTIEQKVKYFEKS